MKSTLIGRALLFAASAFALGGAGAQPPGKPKIDTNADGIVDFVEMQTAHPDMTLAEFNKMDKNSDGQLVRDELFAAHFEKRMAEADSDGDGALSFEEMDGLHRRMNPERLKEFDTDGDGKLNRDELAAMHEKMRELMPPPGRFRAAPDDGEAAEPDLGD